MIERSYSDQFFTLTPMTVSNPYVQYLLEKGYTQTEANKVQRIHHTFPMKIYGRTFNTEREYKEALADFLNGM